MNPGFQIHHQWITEIKALSVDFHQHQKVGKDEVKVE